MSQSLGDERMDSSFVIGVTDWKQPKMGRFTLRYMVQTKAAMARGRQKRKGATMARKMMERLGL